MPVKIAGGTPAKTADSAEKSHTTGGSMSFLKQGAAAKQAQAQAAAKAEAAKAEAGKLWRFFIRADDDSDYRITFLDGSLDEEGTLEAPMWHEHMIQIGGDWKNLPCTSHEEPCPICAMGGKGDNASLVAGFTVIDWTPYTVQNGPNAGKTIKASRKLFIAKRTTYAQLQKYATKQGGLIGVTFEVSRNGDKSPAVGNMFQVEGKETLAQLKKRIGEEIGSQYVDIVEPADFSEEITYYNRAQLIELGVKGATVSGVGKSGGALAKKTGGKDLDEELGG